MAEDPNPLIVDFYKQFIGADDLVYDVGANIGELTLIFSLLARKVIAFEPVEESYAELEIKFGSVPKVALVKAALGEAIGAGSILTSSASPTIGTASMSGEWTEAVKKSGRFGGNKWDQGEFALILTLGDCIAESGIPAFIKIDVEGYELEVLRGLPMAVPALSFEFTPETTIRAHKCIFRCNDLGMTEFNLSLMQEYELGEWTDAPGILPRLYNHRFSTTTYGDIYARMPK